MRFPSRTLLAADSLPAPLTVTDTPAPGCTSSVPYVAGSGGYDTYGIPAAVTTRRGTVLAFAEGRRKWRAISAGWVRA